MRILVAGATGATGRLLARELLARGHHVRAVVRAADRLPADLRNHEHMDVTEAALLDLSDADLVRLVSGCDAAASCLGHRLSWRGVFGPPHRLVTDAVRRLCAAIRTDAPATPVRFVLMNTAVNRGPGEEVSAGQRVVVGLLRALVPPHADNERAAGHLLATVGRDDPAVRWVAVRPDTLVDADAASAYEVRPAPTRSAIFNAGRTSRANVAAFMADLCEGGEAWERWQGTMPVIYDQGHA